MDPCGVIYSGTAVEAGSTTLQFLRAQATAATMKGKEIQIQVQIYRCETAGDPSHVRPARSRQRGTPSHSPSVAAGKAVVVFHEYSALRRH